MLLIKTLALMVSILQPSSFVVVQALAAFSTTTSKSHSSSSVPPPYANNQDKEYPWYFRGRMVLRPALVRLDTVRCPDEYVLPLSFFGWTVGGTIALEYDESPVGPYLEYVCLGGLAVTRNARSKRLLVGQYGSRLCVSKPVASGLCRKVWNLQAETSNIQFLLKDSKTLSMDVNPSSYERTLVVGGWNNVRRQNDQQRIGMTFQGLELLWTPCIKAIWAPLLPWSSIINTKNDKIPLHLLRLSGSPRIHFHRGLALNETNSSSKYALLLGVDIFVTNLLIEISPQI